MFKSLWQYLHKNNSQLFLFCILCALLYLSIVVSLLPLHYHTNDDLAIQNFLSNGYNAVFMTVLFGKLIKFLYALDIQLGFYALTLLLVHSISLGVILYCLITSSLRKPEYRREIILCSILIVLFFTRNVISLTFTTTAFMAGFSGIALFLVSLNGRVFRFAPFIIAGVLLALSFLIRPQAASGVLLFSMPVILWVVFQQFRLGHIRLAIAGLLLMLPMVLARQAEKVVFHYGTSDAYKEFRQFNLYRGQIHDNPAANMVYDHPEVLEMNDWTENDFWLFQHWFFAHEEKFNMETLTNVVDVMPDRSIRGRLSALSADRVVLFMKALVKEFYAYIMLFFSIGILVLWKGSQVSVFKTSGYFLYALIGLLFVSMFNGFKARVFEPVMLGTVLCAFIFVVAHTSAALFNRYIPLLRKTFLIAVLLTFGLQAYSMYLMSMTVYQRRENNEQNLNTLNKQLDGYVVYSQAGYPGLSSTVLNPLMPHPYQRNFYAIGGGWTTFHPLYYERINNVLDVDQAADILPELIDNSEAIIRGESEFIDAVQLFIYETYDIAVDTLRVSGLDSTYCFVVSVAEDIL